MGRNAYGRSIAATADGHVFIQSEADVAHFDGSSWSFVPIQRPGDERWGPDMQALYASDAAHVYFASAGAIGALDGDHFGMFDAGTWRDLAAIDGAGPRDLWTAGQGGTVMHFDGARWSREATNTSQSLTGIRVFTADDVWAWGGELLLHRDASGWAPRMEGLTGQYGQMVTGLAGRSPDALYAVGTFGIARWTGVRWDVAVPLAIFGQYVSGIAGACATSHQLVVVLSSGAIVTRAHD